MSAPSAPHGNNINIQEVKQTTKNILRKMHDLERGRKVGRIYDVLCHDVPCVLLCLRNLRMSLFTALQVAGNPAPSPQVKRFFALLDPFIERVENSVRSNTKIDRGYVGDLLTAHNSLFNFILSNKVRCEVSRDDWPGIVIPAVRVWKNQL